MKRLKVNLEDLISSFTYDSEGLSKEYLSLETGEIVHIPEEVARVVEKGRDISLLPEWEQELVPDAESVLIGEPEKYIEIPVIESKYFYNAMIDFTEGKIEDRKLREKLIKVFNQSRPMGRFKDVLHGYESELEQWYEYEDQKVRDYVIDWLKDNEIIAEG